MLVESECTSKISIHRLLFSSTIYLTNERERAFNSESLCVVTKNFTTLRVSIGDNNRLNGWQASAINLWALQRSYEIPSSDPATLILLFWHAKANWKFKSL